MAVPEPKRDLRQRSPACPEVGGALEPKAMEIKPPPAIAVGQARPVKVIGQTPRRRGGHADQLPA